MTETSEAVPHDHEPTNRELMIHLTSMRCTLGKIDHTLHGNGSPGLVKKVDRLETARNIIVWVVCAVIVAGIGWAFSGWTEKPADAPPPTGKP